jgi:hypothetical protein
MVIIKDEQQLRRLPGSIIQESVENLFQEQQWEKRLIG